MVLRRAERQGGLAVADAEEACFFAVQKFLDHHFRACRTECALETGVYCVERIFKRHGDDHALASSKPVGLDDDRRALLADIGFCLGRIVEAAIGTRWNIEAGAQILGEAFGAFKLCRSLGGTEYADTLGAHFIRKAGYQWRFWPNHHEIDLFILGEGNQRLMVIDTNGNQFRDRRNARIAGCAIEFVEQGGGGEFPC